MSEIFPGQFTTATEQIKPEAEPVKITTTVEVLKNLDPEVLKKLCVKLADLESSIFSKEMAVDAEEIEEVLANPRGVNILIKDDNDQEIGYLSTMPHSEDLDSLRDWDPDIEDDPEALYVESIAVMPGESSLRNFIHTRDAFFNEARAKGYKRITMHARQKNGLSRAIQRIFKAKLIKSYEDWCEFGEPFDYLVIDIPEEKKEAVE